MRKITQKIVLFMLALSLCLSVTGCGEKHPAAIAVDNMFTTFNKLDFEAASMYVDLNTLAFGEDANTITGDDEMYMNNLFDKLSYKILKVDKIDENNAKVTTEITAIDMKPVMVEYFTNALEFALANVFTATEEEIDSGIKDIFIEAVSAPDLATVTNTVEIIVEKTENGWQIQGSDELTDALYGNISEALEYVQNSLNAPITDE